MGSKSFVFRDGKLLPRSKLEHRKKATSIGWNEARERNYEDMKRFYFGNEPPPRSKKVVDVYITCSDFTILLF